MGWKCAVWRRDRLGDQLDRAGVHQRARDDQDKGDDDDGGVAEAVEGVIGGDQARGDGDEEGREGDKVIADAAPDQEAEEGEEEGEEADWVGGRGGVLAGMRGGG